MNHEAKGKQHSEQTAATLNSALYSFVWTLVVIPCLNIFMLLYVVFSTQLWRLRLLCALWQSVDSDLVAYHARTTPQGCFRVT